MNAVLFVGPSLAPDAARQLWPSATILGPVGCGDVYRLVSADSPAAIGIVDGYFDQRLSVWHKEILWAMAHGVRVYGAASMGALRAVELETFGMVGVGRIFEWFRSGFLNDDDEVAVTHDTAEREYTLRSDPLVNIRATLERACNAGVIGQPLHDRLIAIAKEQFYPERSLRGLVPLARAQGVDSAELSDLGAWLQAGNSVDQKRDDAVALIEHMRDRGSGQAAGPTFVFEYTEVWHDLRSQLDGPESPGLGRRHREDR
jgi:hypothetical protein